MHRVITYQILYLETFSTHIMLYFLKTISLFLDAPLICPLAFLAKCINQNLLSSTEKQVIEHMNLCE